jgi:release factor glutamine methyltransferase
VQRVRALCEDRCADQDRPLQYVLGNWGFCGHEFLCRQPILIPRPETEELVELVRANLQSLLVSRGAGAGPLRVLDIGCGTGAIGVALLAPESDSWEEQGCDISEGLFVTAIDINPQAVELALENADRILGADRSCRYRAVHCSVQDFGTAQLLQADAAFDVVVSNPPYIPRAQLASLDRSVRDFEDPRALDGGEDQGLELIKLIIARCPLLMRPTSSADCGVREAETRPLWMEVDLHQGALLQAWAADSEEGRRTVAAVTSFRDFTDRPRFVRVDIRV